MSAKVSKSLRDTVEELHAAKPVSVTFAPRRR